MVFISKVDAWYYIAIVFVVIISGIAFVDSIPTMGLGGMFGLLITMLIMDLPLIWFLYTTDYTLTPDMLIVRCGPFKRKIPRDQIHSISPTRSLLSSPALSLDRLAIRWGKHGYTMISPLEKEAFLRELGFPR